MLCMTGVSYAADEDKWQEAEAHIDKNAATCSEREKAQHATERVLGCKQNDCKQAKKLAAQTLGHAVAERCKSAIRVGACQKGPACQ
jgi:hypothetical protein